MTTKTYGTRRFLLIAFFIAIAVSLTWRSSAKEVQAPTNLVAWDSGHYVQLNWDNDGRTYSISRSAEVPEKWTVLATSFAGGSFVDYGAPRSKLIYYRVASTSIIDGAALNESVVSISTEPEQDRFQTLSAYDKNSIISNSQLTDKDSMTASQIQSFLTSQGSALANFTSGGKSAAQRIYDDCQTHGINPRVVLTTLQKEKGLIRSATANPDVLAMGWSTSDSTTSDFANQIYYGTRQFKLYYNNLGNYGWTVGQSHNVSDGTVTAGNVATAGLYVYTPWIGGGGGGQSGIGGNYLFWDLWTNTFNFETQASVPQTTTGFYWPTGTSSLSSTCGTWLGRDSNSGGCYFSNEYHNGMDIMTAEGSSVYAISDGVVTDKSLGGWGSGNVAIVVRHTLSDGTPFLALYGHIRTSKNVNDPVTGGVAFATIGPWPNGNHLHFGIHPSLTMPGSNWGRMPENLWADTNGFVDPIKWIACPDSSSVSFRINGNPPIHPNGTLIRRSGDGTIYVLWNDQKRGIASEGVLRDLYQQLNSSFDFKDVITVALDEFNSYSNGAVVNSRLPSNGRTHPDGRLIRKPDGEISIVTDGGGRRPFASAPTFSGLGYLFCSVITVTDNEYNSYTPVGPVVDGTGGDVGGGECVPTTTSINFGQTLNGSLASSDCLVPGTSRRYDVYSFTGVQGQGIAASMDSTGFDTYLYLTNSSNQIIDEDNNSGPGSNSRIPGASTFFTLPANGTYRLWTSSSVDNTTGSYSVSLSECSYDISSDENTIGPGNGGASFNMDTSSTCSWSAVSDSTSWLTTTSSGTGDGPVNYSFTANPNTTSRIGHITVGGQVHTVTQIGVGGAGNVRFSASSYTVNENGGTATITVTRSSGVGSGNVSYSTSSGTATANTDYVQASGLLIFSENVTSRTFEVTITDDSAFESNETVNLVLSSPSTSLTLGSPSSATLTINDNDSPVTRTLTIASSNPTSGVNVTVSPTDTGGQGNGATQFSRTYNDGASVTLTAPSTAGSNSFLKWQRAGSDWGFNASTTVTMDSSFTMTAVYSSSSTTNFALPANGGSANASSILGAGFAASGVINGDRRGSNWGNGGGWADANSGVFSDWVEISFNGNKSISEVDVFTLQDNYSNPVEPTEAMTFTTYGVSAFDIQYWNGSSWVTVSGGGITGNNKIWRKITFSPISTSVIRLRVNAAIDNGYTRITEVEVWGEATGGPSLINVALPANGGSANASSILGAGFAASGVINGDRRGSNWGNGGGWADANPGSFQDWVEINFNGNKSISEVDVFTLQDNFTNPVEPTEAMTFTTYGVTAFDVQYWNGSSWVTVPGGTITGNNKVWRKITFSPISTSVIRLRVNAAIDNGYTRITEVEAWGEATGGPSLINVALPMNGGSANASSILGAGFAASGVINGDRRGSNWGNGGGWADANPGVFSDWVEISFNGNKSISEVDVFTLQDNYSNPVEPTEAMTFTTYGVSAFDIQYWNGSSWVTVPGGGIIGNNKVWRKITFSPISTSVIRLRVNAAIDNGYTRITEVEAWGTTP